MTHPLISRETLIKEEEKAYKNLLEDKKYLTTIRSLIKQAYGKPELRSVVENPQKMGKLIKLPVKYDPNDTWENRILFILKEVKDQVFAADVAKKIKEYEPKISDPKALHRATLMLSRLYRKGTIIAEPFDRRYKYALTK